MKRRSKVIAIILSALTCASITAISASAATVNVEATPRAGTLYYNNARVVGDSVTTTPIVSGTKSNGTSASSKHYINNITGTDTVIFRVLVDDVTRGREKPMRQGSDTIAYEYTSQEPAYVGSASIRGRTATNVANTCFVTGNVDFN